jgi:PAS domain S-box-containing protein
MTRVIDTGISENQEDVVELHFGKRYFWTAMQRVQNPDGEHLVQVISYDITDRKQAEEAVRASEEKFATVFQFSPDIIGIVRVVDGVILDVNEAFTKLLGYPRTDIIGKNWNELTIIPVVDEKDGLTKLFQEKGRIADYEFDFTTSDGSLATMLISLVPITVREEPCVLIITHDITLRKRSEEALRQAQAELARGLQERTALEERQRLARELHDSVSQALYGISLGTHTALTLFDTDRNRAIEALNYVISLTQAGLTEMRALIFELRPESLEMEGLVVALVKQTAALRARLGIHVELSTCDEPNAPLATKEALYRIVQEALQNAVKHARADRLEVSLFCEPDSLGVEVCDNGIGFDPLAAYPGHLGLRSMRERAIQQGGSLDIVSAPDRGTQIRVRVPTRVIETK